MPDQRLYKVVFFSQGQVYEMYAQHVSQGGLYGFVEIEGLVFGERSKVVVDPTEERLKREFEGVKRIFLPMHTILRIDEVEKQGASRITGDKNQGDSNVASFPVPVYTPGSPDRS